MLHPRQIRFRSWAGGLGILLALGLLLLTPGASSPQDLLKHSLVTPGESKSIQIYADDIFTWQEGKERVLLLQGRVWLEQGLISLRLQEGVVWVDEDSRQKNGIYGLVIYGEGSSTIPVTLDEGNGPQSSKLALIAMATRGQIPLKTYASKIQQKNLATDTLYQRAVAMRTGKEPPEIRTTTLPRPPEAMPTLKEAPPPAAVSPFTPAPAPPLEGPPKAPPSAVPGVASLPEPTAAPVQQASFAAPPSPFQVIPTETHSAIPGFPGDESHSLMKQIPGRVFGTAPIASTVAQEPIPVPPGTVPGLPPTLPPRGPLGELPSPPRGNGPSRQLNIRPRTTEQIQAIKQLQPNGETAVIIPTGVILTITDVKEKKVLIDIEADRLVFWTKGNNSQDLFNNMRSPQGENSKSLEFFLSGNVEIRNQTKKESQVLRAQEVYYDVSRNVAVAIKGDLEIQSPKSIYPLHFKADQLLQLGPKVFEGRRSEVFSTNLPSDPGLKVEIQEASIEEIETPRRNIFGKQFYDLETGQPLTNPQRILTGRNAVLRLEGVPIFYLPYIRTDAEDPLGPLDSIGFNYSRIFGFQVMSTWDVFDLLGATPDPGKRWQLLVDYLTARGPAIGTDFRAAGKDLFGFDNQYDSLVKAYGIYDEGTDRLGRDRGTKSFTGPNTFIPFEHPEFRGRVLAKLNLFEMPGGFSFQGQVAAISDRNFLEQFFNEEWNRELNQETFAYLKQQQDHWAWTVLVEPRLRDWVTETHWLPKAEGYLLGINLFDRLTYNLRSSAGYAQLRPTEEPSFAYDPNDARTNTGRFDVWQDISYPFFLGPVKVVPYAVLDLAYYTADLSGDDRGRIYGGGGVRANMPLSRLYPMVQSEMFNLDGIFHKIVFSGNYYNVQSSAHISELPQLDRLNDDASDQALRDIYPRQTILNPSNGAFLKTSAIFDPQLYALRRLIDNRVDTLDTIEVLQMGMRQRWQTKRGFPGSEHVVDWMTLDLQGSLFPHSNRDNFGELFGILQYDWTWNVGDRTAFVSSGWFETMDDGPRVFNIGTVINRPDRSNLYLGYRQIDPVNSKAVVASLTYPFSAKYAMAASTMYDFGVNTQTNTFMLSRIGTDLRIGFGISYNSVLNNFGVLFEIMPNLLPGSGRFNGVGSMGAPGGSSGLMSSR